MYEEEKRNRDISKGGANGGGPPRGRPNYYQVCKNNDQIVLK